MVVHVPIDSIIHPMAADYLIAAIADADARGAQAVIVELDTPGGLLDATREINEAILGARTPVVVFVGPRGAQAASAGFFILMAADVAAMAPGTNTGAAHPVAGNGQDIEGTMGEKVEQDSAATIRALAEQRGRDVALAEEAVVDSRSFSATEALDLGLIDLVASDVPALVAALDGRVVTRADGTAKTLATTEAVVEERTMGRIERLLSALSHPQISMLLVSLGMLGLWVEMTHPGMIFPGVAGAISLIVGFYALSVLSVNYAGLALVFLAFGLFIAEFFVPTFGILTVGGVVSLVLGGLMLFRDKDPALHIDLSTLLIMGGSLALITGGLSLKAMRVRAQPVTTGVEGMLHMTGVVRTQLDPEGKVFVHGELWRARAEQTVPVGTRVDVVAVDGLSLVVRPADET